MDTEKMIKILIRKKNQALIKEPLSDIGKAFNDGIETMFNYAISFVYQISNDPEGDPEDGTDC